MTDIEQAYAKTFSGAFGQRGSHGDFIHSMHISGHLASQ